jgi:hypothetical protein
MKLDIRNSNASYMITKAVLEISLTKASLAKELKSLHKTSKEKLYIINNLKIL